MQTIIPPPIEPGATIALIAPASAPKAEEVERAVADLEGAGYGAKTYRSLCEPHGYLSGADEARAQELTDAFTDPAVDAVFCARGGYGVARLLDRLDYGAIRGNPKPLAGYSDITALHVAIDRHAGLVTYHSPNAIDGLCGGGKLDAASTDAFWRAVKPRSGGYTLPADGARTITAGACEGRLIGGNLAVLCGLIGTPFEPDTRGRILFLEDIGEAPYRVDRLLAQLRLAGKLGEVAGVLIGQFTDCEPSGDGPSLTTEDVLQHYLADLGVPVLAGFPAGHDVPNLTLPHGGSTRLDADNRTLTITPNS